MTAGFNFLVKTLTTEISTNLPLRLGDLFIKRIYSRPKIFMLQRPTFFNRSDRNELYIESVLCVLNYNEQKEINCLDLFHYESNRTETMGQTAKI